MDVDSGGQGDDNSPDTAAVQQSVDDTEEFIQIDYHPHSGKESIRVPIQDYGRDIESSPLMDNQETSNSSPWHPFRTIQDMEFAEMCVRHNLSNKSSQEWLNFIKNRLVPTNGITFSSIGEMNNIIESAASLMLGFDTIKFTVPYKTKDRQTKQYNYEVLRRPMWDWVKEVLSDPNTCNYMTWCAERRYHITGTKKVRFWNEPWTGDEFWQLQSGLPVEGSPICLLLWSDKGIVSNFGGRKNYPVIARILNLPSSIRNSNKHQGGRIVGWLPIVEDNLERSSTQSWANHRRIVWHEAMSYVIDSLLGPAKFGESFYCSDKVTRQLYPSILIHSLDYEEQSVATLNRGVNGEAACPKCEELTVNFSTSIVSGTPRSTIEYRKHWSKSKGMIVDKQETIYKPLGLVNLRNCFWALPHTDIYASMSYDVLHANELGVWKRLWRNIKEFFSGDRSASERIQQRISNLPRWSGFPSFPDVLSIDFADGSKYANLLRVILHGIAPEITKENRIIIQCVRSLAVISNYSRFKMHTEDTIAEGREEIEQLRNLLQKTFERYEWRWNTPKVHALLAHLFDDIEGKGITSTYNTKLNEQAHGSMKEAAKRFNDRQNTLGRQIMRQEHIQYALSTMKAASDELLAKESLPSKIQHVLLCGKGPQFSFKSLPEGLMENPAFFKFSHRLKIYLSEIQLDEGRPFVNERLQILRDDIKFQQFYELDVDYVSEEDWSVARSILHCKDIYRGKPRYDCVMIMIDDTVSYARLLFLFEATVDQNGYPLALVQLFDDVVNLNWKDRDLGFRRIKEVADLKKTIFVSLESVIRGVYIVQAERKHEYYVNDLMDNDMLLRLRR